MKLNKRIAVVAIAACLVWSGSAVAQTINISDIDDLIEYSTESDNTYVIDDGDYTVANTIDIHLGNTPNIAINTGVNFEIDAATNDYGDYLFYANGVTVGGGALTVKGGADFSTGLFVRNDLTITDGLIDATGGSGTWAYGIEVGNSLNIQGGTVNATGGSEFLTDGIGTGAVNMTAGAVNAQGGAVYAGIEVNAGGPEGDFSQSGGIVNATGGGKDVAGINVVYGKYAISGGTLNAKGSENANSYGVNSNNFTVSSNGIVNAKGGTGENAYGICIDKNLTMNDGYLAATGGNGVYAYGMYVDEDFTATDSVFEGRGGTGEDAVGLYVNGNLTSNYEVPYDDGNADWLDFGGGSGNYAYGVYVGGNYLNKNLAIDAWGGSGIYSAGLLVEGDFTHTVAKIDLLDESEGTNGYISAMAGKALGAVGIAVNGDWSTTNSQIDADGTAYKEAAGIYVEGNFSHTVDMLEGGYYSNPWIFATAGNAEEAYGIYVGKNFTVTNGSIDAIGNGSTGILVGGDFVFKGEEKYAMLYGSHLQILAQGGSFSDDKNDLYSEGISVFGNFSATNALIQAEGGEGAWNQGIYVEKDFTLAVDYNAVLQYKSKFTGGKGENAQGIYVLENFNATNTSLDATGGSGKQAAGIMVDGNFTITVESNATQTYTATFTGGAGDWADGLETGTYTQNGNITVNAQGGGLTDDLEHDNNNHVHNLSYGIYVYGNATQNGGTIEATAGDIDGFYDINNIAKGAYGMYVGGNFLQTGSTLIGNGSDAFYGTGMVIEGDMIQTGATGEIIANAGTGKNASGIYVGGKAEISHYLEISRAKDGESSTASLWIANTNNENYGLTFRDNSTLMVNSDWLKASDTTGLIVVENGDVSIGNDVNLDFDTDSINNTVAVGFGKTAELLFMKTANGKIYGEFDTIETLTLKFNAFKYDGDTKYALNLERIAHPEDIISQNGGGENTLRLLEGLTAGLPNALANTPDSPTTEALSGLYTFLDGAEAGDEAEMAAFAAAMQKGLTPHATTRLAGFSLQQMDAVQSAFNAGLDSYNKMNYWQLWATPIVFGGDADADTHEFDDYKERFWGGVIGLGKDFNEKFTVALQFHYLDGKIKSDYYKAESDTWGATIGTRYHDFADSQRWNPWVDLSFTYSNQSFDQKRNDLYGYQAKSDADSDLYRVNLAVGSDFAIYDNVFITPVIGLEYTHIRQDSYTEKNSDFALHVGKENFDSLRPKLGLNLKANLSDSFSFKGYAFYRYELMDKRVNLNSNFVYAPDVSFTTKGEDLSRHSGNFGIGVNWQIIPELSLGLNYDLWVKEHYMGHMGSLELRLGF